MATAVFTSISSSSPLSVSNENTHATSLSKSSFLPSSKSLAAQPFRRAPRNGSRRWITKATRAQISSFDHIPKQFREENIIDGLMENYKNVPQSLYGLTPSQIELFMTTDNPISHQSESTTEDSISSATNYLTQAGTYNLRNMGNRSPSRISMSRGMYRGSGRGRRSSPPDLPSLLLDSRIVYLGMPIVPSVTELIVAQFMWLDYDNPTKPIYLYINSLGTQNENKETVGFETEAYAIADAMTVSKPPVYTVNIGMAYGQAAMLLALGKKGYRALQRHASTKLYLPKVNRSSGQVTDMWIQAKELEANADYYVELLAKGTGKSKEEIAKDITRQKYFRPQEAIEYGLADKIMDQLDSSYEKRSRDELLAQAESMRAKQAASVRP